MPEHDYIIVGQGLAGSVLALTLLERGVKVLVMDDGLQSCSSKVAAGMWNPVNFRKNRPVWMASQLIPELNKFYLGWEKKLDTEFVHHRNILRPFQGIDQQNDWLALTADPGCAPFFSDAVTTDIKGIRLNFPGGYGLVNNAGFVDVPVFLAACRKYLGHQQAYLNIRFEAEHLKVSEDHVQYLDFCGKGIIFCDGHKGAANPWFSYLPFRNAKGEILRIKSTGLPEKNIASKGVWIVPQGDGEYKVGATFAWNDLSDEVTAEARQKIETDLRELTDAQYEITRQEAGIRPATADRRPFAGTHPEHDRIHIFNGLGTKGVMIAPWLAGHFSAYLLAGTALLRDVDIKRYIKHYAKN